MSAVADDVTVVIPHIPVRTYELARAVRSVAEQTRQADAIHVATDVGRRGSAQTRNQALRGVRTRWVAFLDDDDEFLPFHLESVVAHAVVTGADVVYPGCEVRHPTLGTVPLREEWGRFGYPFDAGLLREKSYIPVTSLVRTELAQRAGFGPPEGVDTDYDDWGFYLRLLDAGARFSHLPGVTWVWHHGDHNTSGRPDRW